MEGCRDSDDERFMAASKEEHAALATCYSSSIFAGAWCLSGIAVHESVSSAYLIVQ